VIQDENPMVTEYLKQGYEVFLWAVFIPIPYDDARVTR